MPQFKNDMFINEGSATRLALLARSPHPNQSMVRTLHGKKARALGNAIVNPGLQPRDPIVAKEEAKAIISWGQYSRKIRSS